MAPGQTLTYTIQVANLGPADAVNTHLTDPLPPGTVFLGCTTSLGVCTGPPPGTNGTVTVDLATLPAGATASVTIQTKVVAGGGSITNIVTITSDTPDPNPNNNRDEDIDPVVPGTQAIPTLSLEMLALLGAALALAGLWALRRRP